MIELPKLALKSVQKLSEISSGVVQVRVLLTIFGHCRGRGHSCVLEFTIPNAQKKKPLNSKTHKYSYTDFQSRQTAESDQLSTLVRLDYADCKSSGFLIAGGRVLLFKAFQRVFAQCKMLTASSMIWT